MKSLVQGLLSLSTVVFLGGCQPPELNGIQPNGGVPGQVVMVDGARLNGAVVIWDAGLPTETVAPQSGHTARYFQIPHVTTPGSHPVRLRNSNGLSVNTITVNVSPLGMSGWPAPRIEDISLYSFHELGGGKVNLWLAVSAANVDPNALVEVNGVARNSVFYSAIPMSYFNAPSRINNTYGYPVFHYGMLIVSVPNQTYGASLYVKIIYQNGLFADLRYSVAASKGKFDSDNDGLLDEWETSGYPSPSGTVVDLAAMGCNPRRKDILAEVDWMPSARPNSAIWPLIERTFASAPVLNPDGSRGIAIHIDHGQGGWATGGRDMTEDHSTIDFCNRNTASHATFNQLKIENFDKNRLDIFHYCIFGIAKPDGASGRGEIWGNDFMVTFATATEWSSEAAQAGTFAHELGHNLGLFHGGATSDLGDDHQRWKPNQESNMNYRYQFDPVPLTSMAFARQTYSQGMYATITEPHVNEAKGISDNMEADLNEDGTITSVPRDMNTNKDGDKVDLIRNYDEWGRLRLNFNNPESQKDNDINLAATTCTEIPAGVTNCGHVKWRVFYDSSLPPCGIFRVRLDGTGNVDGGLCTPAADCGVTIDCVEPGRYFASVVCDGNRYYKRTGTDSVSIPNDLTNVDTLGVFADSTLSIRLVIIP